MARFLFTNLWTDDLGLPTRTVPVACVLKEKGHDVWFCNPGASPDRVIKEAGLENIIPEVSLGPSVLAPWTTEVWNVDQFSAMFGYADEKYAAHCVDAVIKVIGQTKADVVVDSWNLFSCTAARILKKPLVSIIQADMHPGNKGFIWWKNQTADSPTPVPAFNRILMQNGLDPVQTTSELFIGDLTLCVGTPETDPIPPGEDVIHVGPIFYKNAAARLPDWLESMDSEKPLIWVYSGNPEYAPGMKTFGDSIVVLEAAIDALADRDVRVIMTTGHHDCPKCMLPLPENFRFETFLPGIALADRCDLMIHHGGHGSTMTGAYTGTPAVVIPTYSERESNARRMALLGAAEVVIPETSATLERTVPPGILWERVKQVLDTPSYAKNAGKIRKRMLSFGGEDLAARLISEFAESLE
jgi:UDP:flavonoid glycosyltransferase YjiC (YdhE family)